MLLLWFLGSWDRSRLLLYDFHEVPSEAFVNASPGDLVRFGYEEDTIDALTAFRDIAQPLVAGIPSAPARARRLADYIHGL